jgi:hypothetical protein
VELIGTTAKKKLNKIRGWFPQELIDPNAIRTQANHRAHSKRTIYACNFTVGFGTVVLVMGTADLLGFGSYGAHIAGFATGTAMVVVNLLLFRNPQRNKDGD